MLVKCNQILRVEFVLYLRENDDDENLNFFLVHS